MEIGDTLAANLPLDDARCIRAAENCTAFAAGANASQNTLPFVGQVVYGRWLTYYYICLIFVFALIHLCNSWQRWIFQSGRHSVNNRPTSNVQRKTVAAVRWLTYRPLISWPLGLFSFPSVGVFIILFLSVVVVICMIFVSRPHYHEYLDWGSPPIAIRTGFMAYACVPLMIALAGKANIITILTGYSHEKLNVFHRWTAWITFVLSLIHTIPFFVASLRMGQARGESGYKSVVDEFYRDANPSEYTGVPALAILFGLCIFSLPVVRRRWYEAFYWLHISMAITFLGLLFWHAANIEDSWAYLWATLALWLTSWSARLFWFTRPLNVRGPQWYVGAETTLAALPGGMTKLSVRTPTDFVWRPGQHVFLRFPKVSMLDNHPFTIVSAPFVGHGRCSTHAPDSQTHTDLQKSSVVNTSITETPALVFLARCHAGFTRRLSESCKIPGERMADACIDGPYGGIPKPIEGHYENIILFAGGTGITPCLSWLQFITNQHIRDRCREGRKTCIVSSLHLVWIFRNMEHFQWAIQCFEVIEKASHYDVDIDIRFYVTGKHESITLDQSSESTCQNTMPMMMQKIGKVASGRPSVRSMAKDLLTEGRNFVFVCGPKSMRDDVSQGCAEAQARVCVGSVEEVCLHTEAFGW